tara:strand:- start:245 stop:1555 length:1311 start_codon:yes stop_codon:yes gene_type:complete
MKISVIGLGKLGLPFSFFLASKKNNVLGYDLNKKIEKNIKENTKNIEPDLNRYISKNNKNFKYENNFSNLIKKTNLTFIVLPTPSQKDGSFSNQYIINCLKEISKDLLKKKNKKHIIVITSTVSPGSCEEIFIPFMKKKGLKNHKDFLLVYNPHFIAQGTTIYNLEKPDLILLGCDSDISYKIINNFYSRIYNSKIIKKTSLREGEIAKISINSYITSKISFSNYISELCEKSDETDAAKVLDVIGQDKRINHSYLKIGTKFSGPCFPRDNLALANYSKKKGVNSLIPEKNDKVNKLQTKRLFSILKKISKKNKRVNIGICGMTYKNHTNIIKDSQGYDLLNLIKKSNLKNNSILLYDNYLNSNDIKISKNMTLCTDKKNFIKKADIIFLMYNIKNLGLENYKTKKKKYIVDCWRIYKKLPKYLIKIDLGKYSKFL